MDNHTQRSCSSTTPLARQSGQALIEVMVGLVALLVLVAGLVQFIFLTSASARTMDNARAEAGLMALAYDGALYSPEFIRDLEEGSDRKRHTRDDEVDSYASAARFSDILVDRAAEDSVGWNILEDIPAGYLPSLHGDPDPVIHFGLVKGESSEQVGIISAVQSLLYRSDQIDVESTVWMTTTRGIY